MPRAALYVASLTVDPHSGSIVDLAVYPEAGRRVPLSLILYFLVA